MADPKTLTEAETIAALQRFGWLNRNGIGYGGRRCVEDCQAGDGCRSVCARGPDHVGEHRCSAHDNEHDDEETRA